MDSQTTQRKTLKVGRVSFLEQNRLSPSVCAFMGGGAHVFCGEWGRRGSRLGPRGPRLAVALEVVFFMGTAMMVGFQVGRRRRMGMMS